MGGEFPLASHHGRVPSRGCQLISSSQPPDFIGGGYLKKSEPISLTGSAGGIPPKPPFRPPRPEAEAKRTISSFSNPASQYCSASPSLAANSCFLYLLYNLLLLLKYLFLLNYTPIVEFVENFG